MSAVLVRPRRGGGAPQRRVVRIAHAESTRPAHRSEGLLPRVEAAVLESALAPSDRPRHRHLTRAI
jgi:hypothetical protein